MHKEAITKFGRLLEVKRYSPNTRKVYIGAILLFFKFFKNKNILEINDNDVFRYVEHKIKDENISFSSQKGIIGAIKLFYKTVYNKNIKVDYIYPYRYENNEKILIEFQHSRKESVLSRFNYTLNRCVFNA